ncbi:hypothetical protein DN539_34380, partial [Burkholderia multivorans]
LRCLFSTPDRVIALTHGVFIRRYFDCVLGWWNQMFGDRNFAGAEAAQFTELQCVGDIDRLVWCPGSGCDSVSELVFDGSRVEHAHAEPVGRLDGVVAFAQWVEVAEPRQPAFERIEVKERNDVIDLRGD